MRVCVCVSQRMSASVLGVPVPETAAQVTIDVASALMLLSAKFTHPRVRQVCVCEGGGGRHSNRKRARRRKALRRTAGSPQGLSSIRV